MSRRLTARLALVVGAVAAVAAACQPLPPPQTPVSQYCAASTPTTGAAYQAAFDGLRNTYTEWVTADGEVPVTLPDGRVLWLFGDTFVGTVGPEGSIPAGEGLIRNSFVVQDGRCFTPLMGGTAHNRQSLIPEPAPNEWYWPAAGVVNGSTLDVFLWHLQTGTGGPPALDFTPIDMRVATFSLPSLQLLGVQALPFPTDADHPYGATALVTGGNLYLYGEAHRNTYVATAPLAQMGSSAAWSFWGGSSSSPTWQSDPAQAQPVAWANVPPVLYTLGSGTGPFAQPEVVPYGTGFLSTSKTADAFSDDVSMFTAPTPEGPWTYAGKVADTSASTQQNEVSYGGLSFAVPGGGVVAYSTNASPFASNPPPLSLSVYGPHFTDPIPGSVPPPG